MALSGHCNLASDVRFRCAKSSVAGLSTSAFGGKADIIKLLVVKLLSGWVAPALVWRSEGGQS